MQTIMTLLTIGLSITALIYSYIIYRILKKKPAGGKRIADQVRVLKDLSKLFQKTIIGKIAIVDTVILVAFLYSLGWKTTVCFLIGAIVSIITFYVINKVSDILVDRSIENTKSGVASILNMTHKTAAIMTFFYSAGAILLSFLCFLIFSDIRILFALPLGYGITSTMLGLLKTKFFEPKDEQFSVLNQIKSRLNNIEFSGSLYSGLIVLSLILSIAMAKIYFKADTEAQYFPFMIMLLSLVSVFVGSMFVRVNKSKINIKGVIIRGSIISIMVFVAGLYPLTSWFMREQRYSALNLSLATVAGVLVVVLSVIVSSYFMPLIAKTNKSDLLNNAILFLINLILVTGAYIGSHYFAGYYGLSLAVLGAVTLLPVFLTVNVFQSLAKDCSELSVAAGMPTEAILDAKNTVIEEKALQSMTKNLHNVLTMFLSAILFVSFGLSLSSEKGIKILDLVNLKDISMSLSFLLGLIVSIIAILIVRSIQGSKTQSIDMAKDLLITIRDRSTKSMVLLSVLVLSGIIVGLYSGALGVGYFLLGALLVFYTTTLIFETNVAFFSVAPIVCLMSLSFIYKTELSFIGKIVIGGVLFIIVIGLLIFKSNLFKGTKKNEPKKSKKIKLPKIGFRSFRRK